MINLADAAPKIEPGLNLALRLLDCVFDFLRICF